MVSEIAVKAVVVCKEKSKVFSSPLIGDSSLQTEDFFFSFLKRNNNVETNPPER